MSAPPTYKDVQNDWTHRYDCASEKDGNSAEDCDCYEGLVQGELQRILDGEV